MKQRGLTIITPILESRKGELDTLLRAIGNDIQNQPYILFDQITLLHYASWTMDDRGARLQLIFESNFDGGADAFLRQLTARAYKGLNSIYQTCDGYAPNCPPDAMREYLARHAVNTDTFYVSCGGFTRDQIRDEQSLREEIETFLGAGTQETDPAAVRQSIQQFVRSNPKLEWACSQAPSYSILERLRARDFVILLILLAGLIGPWFGGWRLGLAVMALWAVLLISGFLILRRKEKTDSSTSDKPVQDTIPDPSEVDAVASGENRKPQNHMSAITVVKPGWFRFALLKFVLAAIEALGRVIYFKVNLVGIPSIHFARWAVIDGGKRLLFLSNFDGSWEHYLGEFIDQAAAGLTGVWSNCKEFPRTSDLIHGGATDEQRFKAYARQAQLYTQVWYSAYPYLSVVNIQNNAAIRAGLWGDLEGDALAAWLRRL